MVEIREKILRGLEGEADGGAAVVVGLFCGFGIEIDYLERAAEALLGDVDDVVALAGEGYGQDLRAIAFYQDEFAYVAKRSLRLGCCLCLLGSAGRLLLLSGGRGLLQDDDLRRGLLLLLLLWSRLADHVRFRRNEIGEAAGGDWIELQQAFCLGDLKLRDGIDRGHHGQLTIVVGALIIAEGETGIRIQQILQRERAADASGQSGIRIRGDGLRAIELMWTGNELLSQRRERQADLRAEPSRREPEQCDGLHVALEHTRNREQECRGQRDLSGSHFQSLHNLLDAWQRIPVAPAIVLLWGRFFIRGDGQALS